MVSLIQRYLALRIESCKWYYNYFLHTDFTLHSSPLQLFSAQQKCNYILENFLDKSEQGLIQGIYVKDFSMIKGDVCQRLILHILECLSW